MGRKDYTGYTVGRPSGQRSLLGPKPFPGRQRLQLTQRVERPSPRPPSQGVGAVEQIGSLCTLRVPEGFRSAQVRVYAR
eukprot:15447875-Alexandrium_andersonii.AAC.1